MTRSPHCVRPAADRRRPAARLAPSLLLVGLALAGAGHAQTPADVLESQRAAQREAAEHQRRIESLDDRTRERLAAYREAHQALVEVRRRNEELRRQIVAREAALSALQSERHTLQQLRLDLLPRLRRMVEALDQLVERDLPFLQAERRLRVAELRRALADVELDIPELLRRVLQAYLVEAAYGYDLAAERGTLRRGESAATVDFLRLGRLALFYLTLDGRRAGVWDRAATGWVELPESGAAAVAEALAILRREAPPKLVELPLGSGR